MKTNKNIIICTLLILTIFCIVGSVNASDSSNANSTIGDTNSETVSVDSHSSLSETSTITHKSNSNNNDNDKDKETAITNKKTSVNSQINDKETTIDYKLKSNSQGKDKLQDSLTHIVNNNTVNEIFSGENNTLGDSINNGDTLDFQGTIDQHHSIIINKPINVISSTKDAIISLHTIAGSLMGEDPGNSFVVNHGGSGSYISGLYLNNTECWIHNVENAIFYNMTMHVQNARVGSGVGQTSIRYCNNVTLDSCHIYTENNGGSSSFVWTGTSNSTIINSVVEGQGQVGNLVYIGNPYNTQDKPANFTMSNVNNIVKNCTIITPNGGGICIPIQNLATNTTIDSVKAYASGSTIGSGTNGKIINCEVYNGCGITVGAGSVATNNKIMGTGSTTIQKDATVHDNEFKAVTISGANVIFENNTVSGKLTISQPTNVKNNNLSDVQINTNGKTSHITYNNVTGTITSNAEKVVIDSNNINTENDYTIIVNGANNTITNNTLLTSTKAGTDTINVKSDTTIGENTEAGAKFEITDETYSKFFDSNGSLFNTNVTDYSTITLNGTFNDKIFKFENIIVSIKGNNATINNGFISTDNNAVIEIENIIFNNTKEGIENTILLNTNGNIVRNVKIYRTSTNGTSREIVVNGDKNKILSNTFELEIPVINMDYSQYPFAMSNTSAISIMGSFNNINSNTITIINTTNNKMGTISVIDLASQSKSNDNTVNSNTIIANSTGYLYGINLGANTDCNTINSNKITLNSDVYTSGIQIGYAPAYNNIINSNTLNLKSPLSYGIIVSANGGEIAGTTINSNNIYITANQLWGIVLSGSSSDAIKDITLEKNTVNADGNYSIGIGISGKNIQIKTNTLIITGTTNSTDETSWDTIKPTTAGLILQDSSNIEATNNKMTVINGANIILKNTKDSKITTTSTSYTLNAENNTNILLINSNNNIIEKQNAYTNGAYVIELNSSSNNNITDNNINANNLRGGNQAIKMDATSVNNYFNKNIPVFALLNDDTYSTLFNENGTYKFPENATILSLVGDLHNKDLIFTNTITFRNSGNYTIYNGTIIVSDIKGQNYIDRFVNFENININNTNKPVFIDNLSTTQMRNLQIIGGIFSVYGDNITAFESVRENITYSIVDVEDATIIMDGANVTAFKMIRGSYTRNEYLDVENCNIILKATGINKAVEAININLDIYNNKIYQEGCDVSTLFATNVYANGQFFMNNHITAKGNNLTLIKLKDNQGSNPTLGNNTILATSSNPVSVMNISNAGTTYIGKGQYDYDSYNKPNIIIVNATNGKVPLIYIDNNGYVRNNHIIANDVYGDNAVAGNNLKLAGNTPKIVHIAIDEKEIPINKESIIRIKITDDDNKNITGNVTVTLNGEETTVINNTIKYTPTTSGNITITTIYTDPNEVYGTTKSTVKIAVKIASNMTIAIPSENTVNKTTPLTIIVTTEDGNLIKDSQVNIISNCINETITLKDGFTTYMYTPKNIGEDTIKVTLVSDTYLQSIKTAIITVTPDKDTIINNLNNVINEQNDTINNLTNLTQTQNNTINNLTNLTQTQNNTINNLTNKTETQAKTINNLTNLTQTQNNTINNLTNKTETQAKTIQTQTETIAKQNQTNNELNNTIQTQIQQLNDANNKLASVEQQATATIETVKAAKTVKKSKKFTITVKLNKAVKGKKVFVIFNGKTYSAKTNANGISKITIKKSALKKLGGKKVKYQVISGEKIIKKTVKVKK